MPHSVNATLPPPTTPPAAIQPPLHSVLDRPKAQRIQEFRYRFGQAVVFGLPVLTLQWFGRSLGGVESGRWVALFQALLAGWVVYVAATGMLAEGVLWALGKARAPLGTRLDALVGGMCIAVYLASLGRPLGLLLSPGFGWPSGFHWCVVTIGLWSSLRWWGLSRRCRPEIRTPGREQPGV